MVTIGILLWWVAFTGLMAWAQGWLMPALKETPDNTPQSDRQKCALHWLLGAVWALPALLLLPFYLQWLPLLIAVLVRVVVFDPVLNFAEGTPVFAVGGSANTDKLLQSLAVKIGFPVTYLSALFRLLAFLLLAAATVYKLWL